MKRRKFFETASYGMAGLTLAGACTPSQKGENAPASGTEVNQPAAGVPAYRKNLKTSFSGGKLKSANDTITLAIIGVGGYGNGLIQHAARVGDNVRVKYICDVDDTRGGQAMVNLEKMQGFKPTRVRDMRRVFDDKEVDAVFCALPEHWHALATIWACQAGKDVYVEKCVSHNIFEGQKMVEAAMKYERVVQCGLHNRSAAYTLSARDYINSGELGELVAVHVRQLVKGPIPFIEKEKIAAPSTIDWNLWLGPAPKAPYSVSRNKSWFYYWDYAEGMIMNDINHQLDMARLVLNNLGFPKSVCCAGGRYFFDDNRDTPDYQMTTFDYGKFVLTMETGQCTPYMEKTSGKIRNSADVYPEWDQNSTKVQILGTKRMMYLGRMGGGWQVFDKGGEIVAGQTGLYPRTAHLENFFDCIRTRKQPNAPIVEGHKTAVLVHLASLAYRAGNKQLIFDPETETILNNPEANAMIKREYRKGFEVPEQV